MFKLKSKFFLTGEELNREELEQLLELAQSLKESRGKPNAFGNHCEGKTLALLFEKPSLRTRVSFTVAMQELGGTALNLVASSSKKEEPEDVIQVLGGYCHAVMSRTHSHTNLERMVKHAKIPVINGLSDTHHPCQVLADLLTLKQVFGNLKGLKLTYIGDGNNMLHSLLLLAPYLGVDVHYAVPEGYEPNAFIVKRAMKRAKEGGGSITDHRDPFKAADQANILYTDVWTSMGFEEESKDRELAFQSYQINEELFSKAAANAIVLHCMPMVRGKEITDSMADHPKALMFQQSENRLHAQKALLVGMISGGVG